MPSSENALLDFVVDVNTLPEDLGNVGAHVRQERGKETSHQMGLTFISFILKF